MTASIHPRFVVKVGTRVLTDDEGELNLVVLRSIVDHIAQAMSEGAEVILVSSGAVGLGRRAIGLPPGPSDTPTRQACAAIGQSRLMAVYESLLQVHGICCAQVLLSQSDFDNRKRYNNLRNALSTLLRLGVLPILNENDAVAIEELEFTQQRVFGDNDKLSSLVASELNAERLVLLTDVDGVYDKNPIQHSDAVLLSEWENAAVDTTADAGAGRGGMASKIEAARIAARSGCVGIIASGRDPSALGIALAGGKVGTRFTPKSALSSRRRWIAFAAVSRGSLTIDQGAVDALRKRGASLLAKGVTHIDGPFRAGDVVELIGPDKKVVGRGIPRCSSEEAQVWAAGQAPQSKQPLIRRNYLVLEEE